jgi:hypothetical protein
VKFNEQYKLLTENLNKPFQFKSIKTIKREFYPRNFELSPAFIKAFQEEHIRLVKKGLNPKAAFRKLCKALLFHTS